MCAVVCKKTFYPRSKAIESLQSRFAPMLSSLDRWFLFYYTNSYIRTETYCQCTTFSLSQFTIVFTRHLCWASNNCFHFTSVHRLHIDAGHIGFIVKMLISVTNVHTLPQSSSYSTQQQLSESDCIWIATSDTSDIPRQGPHGTLLGRDLTFYSVIPKHSQTALAIVCILDVTWSDE